MQMIVEEADTLERPIDLQVIHVNTQSSSLLPVGSTARDRPNGDARPDAAPAKLASGLTVALAPVCLAVYCACRSPP